MWRELLNLNNYYWNPHAVPMLITAFVALFEGIGIYLKNKKTLTNRMYFIWMVTVFGWLCGFWTMLSCREPQLALFWYKHFTFWGVAFIPLGSYLLSLSFMVKDFSGRKAFISIVVVVLAGFCLVNLTTDLIVESVHKFFWGYFPQFTKAGGGVFLLFWASLYVLTVVNLFNSYRTSESAKKNQMRILLWATILVYIGAVDFIPIYFRIPVYPFGYVIAMSYAGLIAYMIVRYRTFEIETVLHRTIMWLITSLWLILPAYVLFQFARPWLRDLSALGLTLFSLSLFYAFLWYYLNFQPRIDHFFRRRKYDYQTILGKIAEKIAAEININDMAGQLLNEVCETMYLRNSLFYVLSATSKNYVLIGKRGYVEKDGVRQRSFLEVFDSDPLAVSQPGPGLVEPNDSPICRWLNKHKDVLEKEPIEIDPQYEPIRAEVLSWFKEQEVELLVPLVFEQNVIGILGLGRKESLQRYTAKDIELLRKLGQEAGVTVFNALHYKDVIEKERLEEEMAMGRQIQISLLPHKTPAVAGLEIEGWMQPAREIGGDYYDFVNLSGGKDLCVVIGDVSGKGVAAGLMMTMVKMAIHTLSRQAFSPKETLVVTNNLLYEQIAGQKFMTLLYLVWKAEDRTFTYSSAGHEHILIYRTTAGVVEAIVSGGFMLGMIPDIEIFLEELDIKMEPHDKILLYTDGVTEAYNEQGERFGLNRLKSSFGEHGTMPVSEMIKAVKSDIFSFMGECAQYDDITLVVMEAT